MKPIAIKVIYDNRKENAAMREGWGFSCLIDLGPRKILFDTGADTKAFFANLQTLDIRSEEITDVVFSHKHADHTTGMREILKTLKPGSRLFLPKGFPTWKIPRHLETVIVKDFGEIDTRVFSLVLKGGFCLYEQALVLQTSQGLLVITGCAHPGIVNILEAAQQRLSQPIHLVLGGFHLFRKNRESVSEIVDKFVALHVAHAAPCHCSGDEAIAHFQGVYQERFHKIGAGSILTISP